eukprot:jgi/Mesen1/8339/ME000461S07755
MMNTLVVGRERQGHPVPMADVAERALPDASAAAVQEVRDLMPADDLAELQQLQLTILGRLQDSNAVLAHFNDFSARSLAAVVNDFSRNTRLLRGMRTDLDAIFRRIRNLKERIKKHHPDAFEQAGLNLEDKRPDLEKAT